MAQLPKKGLIFSLAYFPRFVGGAEIAIKEITDRISPEEIKFFMITARMDRRESRQEKIGNIEVYRVGFGLKTLDKFLIPVLGCIKATSLNRKENFDFVWAMMANQAGVAASFFKKWSSTPMLLTMQEGDEEEHLKRYVLGVGFLYRILIRPWYLLSIKKADKVTSISNYLLARVRNAGFKNKAYLVPNGVDLEKFSKEYSSDMLSMSRSKMGFYPEDIVILTASRLVKKNAIDDLARALEFLPVEYKLLVLGDGQDKDKIEEILKEKGLRSRAVFLGFIEPHLLPFYFKLSNIFARPSLSEGMGNAFIEAMAAGIPVVATPVGGITDFLTDGKTGFFAEAGNPKNIAETIMRAHKEKEQVINNARKKAEEYDWKIIAGKMKEVFEKI